MSVKTLLAEVRRSKGLCTNCGKVLSHIGALCNECREYSCRSYQRHKDKKQAYARANQLIYTRTLKGKYACLKRNARTMLKDFSLSFEEFAALRVLPCHYCGNDLSPTSGAMDRKDSSIGYVSGNVVPCCWPCNDTKGSRLSYQEMQLVMSFRRGNVSF